MRKHKKFHAGSLSNSPRVFSDRVTRKNMFLESRCVRHTRHQAIDRRQIHRLMHEHIGTLCKLDQIL